MYKFKQDCLVNSYKLANGTVKLTSVLHRPSGLRVERDFIKLGIPYNSTTLDDIFGELYGMVRQYELRKKFLQGQSYQGVEQDVISN